MNLSVGIVGFPNVGKSTLFNALLKKQVAASANYPFTTIEPNVGVVEVPDERVDVLKELIEKTDMGFCYTLGQIYEAVNDKQHLAFSVSTFITRLARRQKSV